MNEKGWLARYHHDFNRIAPLFSTFARINLTLEGQKCPTDFPPFYLSNDYCEWGREGREIRGIVPAFSFSLFQPMNADVGVAATYSIDFEK